jgi:Flp pilus assembly protein TadG
MIPDHRWLSTDRRSSITDGQWPAADQTRGAVLVHTALALFGLMAFSALAIDYGAFWTARAQAQNAADAAALAGAVSLAWSAPGNVPRAQAAAVAAGSANLVLGTAPSITAATDVFLVTCPPGAPGVPDTCIRANVYRAASRANALPTFFAQVMGIASQDVRATATAQVETGNAANCLKPWAVADKWAEHWENGKPNNGPWTTSSHFDKYMKQGNQMVIDPSITTPDVYVAPSASSPGTGFTPFDAQGNKTSDYGLELTLKIGSPQSSISSGWFMALDLLNSSGGTANGADNYKKNIEGCSAGSFKIGDTVDVSSEQGNMVGPTKQGVDTLISTDPGATWDPTTQSITGSCAPGMCGDGLYHAESPRIVPVALFNIDAFLAAAPTGKSTVPITNIMGFFVEGVSNPSGGANVTGRLVAVPGLTEGAGSVTETASFLRTVLLVR